jgi:hypothetical protein
MPPAPLPPISVVLPVFNGARTILRAVQSILAQSVRELELIVVDDGSTDDTASLVQALIDPRIRLVRTAHRGVVAAANLATDQATAPLIARMDADDVAHPRRLQLQRQLLKEGPFDVVGCQVRIVDETGQPVPSLQRYQRWINRDTLDPDQILALRFVEFPLVNPTLLAVRKYFELGFRSHAPGVGDLPEDYDLMLRAAQAGFRFGKVPHRLLDWTDPPDRLTRTDTCYSPAAFMRCRRMHLLEGPLRDVPIIDLWGVGKTGKDWLRWLQSHQKTVRRGYDVHPRKVNQTIHGVPILHPDQMPPAHNIPLVIAVGAEAGRPSILPHLVDRGYTPGRDAWFVA